MLKRLFFNAGIYFVFIVWLIIIDIINYGISYIYQFEIKHLIAILIGFIFVELAVEVWFRIGYSIDDFVKKS